MGYFTAVHIKAEGKAKDFVELPESKVRNTSYVFRELPVISF